MPPTLKITFGDGDISVDTIARGLDAYADFIVELTYAPGVTPYCANPVCIAHTTNHAALVVNELDDLSRPDATREHTIPFEALADVEIQ